MSGCLCLRVAHAIVAICSSVYSEYLPTQSAVQAAEKRDLLSIVQPLPFPRLALALASPFPSPS
jgi:hypothetical protein